LGRGIRARRSSSDFRILFDNGEGFGVIQLASIDYQRRRRKATIFGQ
jgi:hypothetical protein